MTQLVVIIQILIPQSRRSAVRPDRTTSVRPAIAQTSRELADDASDSRNLAQQQSTGITADRAAIETGPSLT